MEEVAFCKIVDSLCCKIFNQIDKAKSSEKLDYFVETFVMMILSNGNRYKSRYLCMSCRLDNMSRLMVKYQEKLIGDMSILAGLEYKLERRKTSSS